MTIKHLADFIAQAGLTTITSSEFKAGDETLIKVDRAEVNWSALSKLIVGAVAAIEKKPSLAEIMHGFFSGKEEEGVHFMQATPAMSELLNTLIAEIEKQGKKPSTDSSKS